MDIPQNHKQNLSEGVPSHVVDLGRVRVTFLLLSMGAIAMSWEPFRPHCLRPSEIVALRAGKAEARDKFGLTDDDV